MNWLYMCLLGLTPLMALENCGVIGAIIWRSPNPLIVKSPYFHSWIDPNTMYSNDSVILPFFWNGMELTWASRIQVDNTTTYEWMGQNLNIMAHRPKFIASFVTPTRSIFTYEAGSVGFNATFLNPIDPSDLVRQSLPFGYIYLDAWSLDGNPHSIQISFYLAGDILSPHFLNGVQSSATSTGNMVYYRMTLSNPQPFVEDKDMANDAALYFAMENKQNMTWDTGIDAHDLSFKVDLGRIIQTNESVAWALGLVRDPAIRDTSLGSTQLRRSYYWSAYNSMDDIIQDFIGNFDSVKSSSINLDYRIMADGYELMSDYDYLLSMSLRLTLGAMDVTVGSFPNGTTDSSDVRIFIKDMGTSKQVHVFFYSNAVLTLSSRVSPVEVLYASLPAILYLNSSLASYLLEPLLEYQDSSNYNDKYAAPDLGPSYPIVAGNPTYNGQLGVESCSNMLIMAFAHASKSGDGTLLNRYYNLLHKWAQYLERSGLCTTTEGFQTSDGDTGPYLSNLVLKGILGIYAMSRISDAAGRSRDSSHYLSVAQNYTSRWKQLALSSSGHITSVFGNTTTPTWGLTYNLYAARLLSATTLIDDTIYTQQSQFYGSQVRLAQGSGFPYDQNSPSVAKSHWTMFTAAAMPDTSVRNSLIGMVSGRFFTINSTPFPSTYDPRTGKTISGIASPALGAMFAPITLNLTDRQISGFSSVPSESSGRSAKNVGAIAGGTIAGVLGLCIVLVLVFVQRKRGIKRHLSTSREITVIDPFHVPQTTPSILANWARSLPIMSKSPRKIDISNTQSSEGHATPTGVDSSAPIPGNGPSADILMEVERLRREVDEIRNERIHDTEPPPLYDLGNRLSAAEDHAPFAY